MSNGSTGIWAGRVICALVTLFLVADGVSGLLNPEMLRASVTETGFPFASIAPISVLALVCAGIYAVPRTATLGAILVTGFLGGAIVTHVRVSPGIVPPEIICMVVGVFAWLGQWLRDARVRALLPVSS